MNIDDQEGQTVHGKVMAFFKAFNLYPSASAVQELKTHILSWMDSYPQITHPNLVALGSAKC